MRGWLGVVAGIAATMACDSGTPAPERLDAADEVGVETRRLPHVSYVGGCSALLDEEVWRCLVEQLQPSRHGPLRLWIDDLDPEVEVRLDGKPLDHTMQPCESAESCVSPGMLVTVNSLLDHGMLEIRVAGKSALELVVEPMPADFIRVRTAVEDAFEGENNPLANARAIVEAARPWLSETARHQLDCYEVRLAYAESDWTTVFERPQQLANEHHPVDRVCIADLNMQAAFVAIERQPDFEVARTHLRAAANTGIETAQVESEFHWGLIEQRLGRPLASLQRLRDAAKLARRIGNPLYAADADTQAAVALASLGRFGDATDLYTRALAEPTLDIEQARVIRDRALWIQLSWRNEDSNVPDPSAEMREQIEIYVDTHDRFRADRMRINLALAAEQNHDYTQVDDQLRDIDLESLDLRNLVYYEILQAGVAGSQRRFAAAREHLDRADVFAASMFEPDYSLRASLARFELELQAGRESAALAAFARVEHFADRVRSSISPSAGRSLFDIRLRRARAEQIELLLRLDQPRAAMCTVLGARARNVQTLAAGRDRLDSDSAARRRYERLIAEFSEMQAGLEADVLAAWALSGGDYARENTRLEEKRARLETTRDQAIVLIDQAPSRWDCDRVLARDPDHALITMHLAPDGGWWFFGARDQRIHRVWVAAKPSKHEVAVAAFESPEFAALLEGATRVVVVPVGEMNGVEFHRISSLLDIPVTHGLGLDPPQRGVEPVESAVVHAGARLQHAESEAEQVAGLLRVAGWTVTSAWPGTAAPPPELLHFAGHGNYAGTIGWDSSLWLQDNVELTSAEVLANQWAPTIVILGACDAGTNNSQAIDGGMNMASAFLLAGAELVIAPDSPVDDRLAKDFALALHRETPGPDADVGAALVTALARVQRDEPNFAAWRAWVP